ncbi:uncharacterized protein LOC134281340 [Saccostrea cucullata]|uniref:uncharacterized protein LOC134281340 n=1 Tax=Saccostrea cuccullata TaxID=36930 RepID=UPI002ED17ACE
MEGRLKATRAGNRSAVTKLFGRFLDLKENTASEVTEEIEIIRKSLTQKRQTLQELNERILDALSEEDIEEEITNTDEYMYELDCKIKKTEKFTEKVSCKTLNASAECFVPALEIHDSNVNTSAAINSSETACENILNNFPASDLNEQSNLDWQKNVLSLLSNHATNNHRLPKLNLPDFDGNILQWNMFWDSFESTIHRNQTLTPIQKFSYLKAQLQDAAAQTIAGFTLTNANYETAIDLLKERFGQPQKIINAHMRALMELQAPRNDAISLRNYGDCLESHVRSLECLGQKQEMYGALLIPVIMNKLPAEIRKNIAREYDGDNISLHNLRKAISKEVKTLESGQIENSDGFHATALFLTGASKKQCHVHNGHNQKTKESTPYVEKTEIKSRPCIYCCTKNHFPGDCKKVTEVSTRFDILKRKKLCFNCLGNHRAADCKSRNRCKTCQKKHHTSICDMKLTRDRDEPTKSTIVNIVGTSKPKPTEMNVEQRHKSVLWKSASTPMSRTVDSIQERSKLMTNEIQQLKSELKTKTERMNALEQENGTLLERLLQFDQQRNFQTRVENGMKDMMEQMNKLAHENGHLHNEVQELKDQVVNIKTYSTHLEHLNAKNISLQSRYDYAQRQISDLNNKVQTLENQLQTSQGPVESREKDYTFAVRIRDDKRETQMTEKRTEAEEKEKEKSQKRNIRDMVEIINKMPVYGLETWSWRNLTQNYVTNTPRNSYRGETDSLELPLYGPKMDLPTDQL